MEKWYIYLIRTKNNHLYTGITIDIKRRFDEHQNEPKKGSKFLRGKGPLKLELKRKVGSKSLASKLEAKIKTLSKSEKEKLITSKYFMKKLINQLK